MPIIAKDVSLYLSIPDARQGWQSAGTPGHSLGGYVSTTPLNVAVPLNNLFEDVTGEQNEVGVTDYRCVFVRNGHSSLTLRGARLWMEPFANAVAMVLIGTDPVGATKQALVGRQAAVIQSPTDAPAGVVFYRPLGKASSLLLGDLPSESVCAVWVQRTVRQVEPVDNDGFTFRVIGETRR